MSSTFPGIGLAGYKSFGDELQYLAELGRLSAVIGPNNSGKSTVLGYFASYLEATWGAINGSTLELKPQDERHVNGVRSGPFKVAWPIEPRPETLEGRPLSSAGTQFFDFLSDPDHSGWPIYERNPESLKLSLSDAYIEKLGTRIPESDWPQVANDIANGSLQAAPRAALEETFHSMLSAEWLTRPPPVRPIPAHRHMTSRTADGSTVPWPPDGAGIILQLQQLKNHEPHERDKAVLIELIEHRVKQVLELTQFSFRISGQLNLIFNIDGNDRALDSVGTGYEHIFLLVAASVVYPNDLLCVEEPEVHMHPRLQRRLAAYLDTIGNQVLISTHSPTLIDALAGTVFRLSMIENSTRIESRVGEELLHVFDDLGYRASDLLQTNFVIWVEGPSDRIYVNAWIREVDADLVEGIHFRVMFYGGSLLSHLTVDRDPEDTSERIYLPQLNQRFMILADSDRRSADDPLKARVERIVQEAEARSHGSVWVTAGRTIENYLSPSDMKSAIEGAHPSATANEEYDQYGDALEATSAASTSFEVDKVKVAQHAVTSGVRLDYLNLRKSVEWLVGLIKDANN